MAKKKKAKGGAPRKKAAPKKTTEPRGSSPRSSRSPRTPKHEVAQFTHGQARRTNNPHVGLVTPETDPPDSGRKTYQYDPHLDPQLVWAGKAEHTSFEVPTVSLHVHERIDPRTIIGAVRASGDHGDKPHGSPSEPSEPGGSSPRSASGSSPRSANGSSPRFERQRGLFEDPEENPPRREAVEFYKHAHGWSNRLVAGDSLLVMNSLLEKEGLAGKVQMIYLDPPYGIRYGSNFQPFVHQRDVKDRKDEDLTAEPEMLRAFRDTWELGIHSYLAYLRDRLLLARELLHESGSVFVQIGDENVHHVREIMDEVFGSRNGFSLLAFQKTTSLGSQQLSSVFDYLLWYGRDRSKTKFRPLYRPRGIEDDTGNRYTRIEFGDGSRRVMTKAERDDPAKSLSKYLRGAERDDCEL